MRLKKEIQFEEERKHICNQIICMLDLDEEYSFTLYDLDNDEDRKLQIMLLAADIRKYFVTGSWTSLNGKTANRSYLSIVKNVLTDCGYKLLNKRQQIIDNNGDHIFTMRYFIIS
jgi:hypothetical protein